MLLYVCSITDTGLFLTCFFLCKERPLHAIFLCTSLTTFLLKKGNGGICFLRFNFLYVHFYRHIYNIQAIVLTSKFTPAQKNIRDFFYGNIRVSVFTSLLKRLATNE